MKPGNAWVIISHQCIPYALGEHMVTVEMTSHLYRFFPNLKDQDIKVEAGSVADVLAAVEILAPGFCHYIVDEQGAVRRHVKLCINDALVVDRKKLSDQVNSGDTVFIFQALSGG